jgi:hypothetical protein
LTDWTAARQRAQRWHDGLAWARVAALLALALTWYERCGSHGPGATAKTVVVLTTGALVVALFAAVAAAARRLARATDAQDYYQAGLGRLAGKLPEATVGGDKSYQFYQPPGLADEHPYAGDLDLFGPQSLFALLNMGRTSSGQETLARWLLAGARREEVLARQAAVAELAAAVELREELWRAAGAVGKDVRTSALATWLEAPVKTVSFATRLGMFILGLAGLVALGALAFGLVAPALATFVGLFVIARRFRAHVDSVGLAAQSRADELAAVVGLAGLIEAAPFASPRLVELRATLSSGGISARVAVARLQRLIGWFESRRNPFFAIITAPMLLSTQFAFAIEAWRAQHGPLAARWMAALGQLEALVSLATFAFEHPQLPFPEIVADDAGPVFEGRALAHPLLPPATRIANDVTLDAAHRLLLVTGSNMSGKSTYLRTIGANAVLGLAGAPVVAERLRLSGLAIGASLRISDSLQAGVSRFFAEIKRLRTVVDLCEQTPQTLFLLDEILHGTNSEDRLAGAGSLVKRLVERGAIGLCTTHDLALARIVDEIGPAAANVHFEDVISEGQIRFDYRVKPGVVTRGNALALMKLVGLPV